MLLVLYIFLNFFIFLFYSLFLILVQLSLLCLVVYGSTVSAPCCLVVLFHSKWSVFTLFCLNSLHYVNGINKVMMMMMTSNNRRLRSTYSTKLKLTTDRHEVSSGLSAIAELLVVTPPSLAELCDRSFCHSVCPSLCEQENSRRRERTSTKPQPCHC